MALNSSGPISLAGTTSGQSIEVELGGNGTTQISLNDASVRTLAGVPSGAIVMPTNFWGKANAINGYLLSTNVTSASVPLFSVVQSDTSGMISYQTYSSVGVFFNPDTGVISSSSARTYSVPFGNQGAASGVYSPTYDRWVLFYQGTNLSGYMQFSADCTSQPYNAYISSGYSDTTYSDLFIKAGEKIYITTTRPTTTWSYTEYSANNSTSSGTTPAGLYSSSATVRCGGFAVTPDRTKMFAVFVQSGTTVALCSINLSTGAMTSVWSLFSSSYSFANRAVYSGITASNSFLYVTSGSTSLYCFTASLTAPVLQWSKSYSLPSGLNVLITTAAGYPGSQGTFLAESANSILLVQGVSNGGLYDGRIAVVGFNKTTGAVRFSYVVTTPGGSTSQVYFAKCTSPVFVAPPSVTSTRALVHLSIGSSSFSEAGAVLALPIDNGLANGTYSSSGGYGSGRDIVITNYTASSGTATAPASPILTAMTRTGSSVGVTSSAGSATGSASLVNNALGSITGA